MLKVIVTGFVGSGTSFTCQLVSAMGFHPGSEKNLRPGDGLRHKTGFWEYMPLAAINAAITRADPAGFQRGDTPLEGNWEERYAKELEQISAIVERDGVEVYKDVLLTTMHAMYEHLYPNAKWIFVTRQDADHVKLYGAIIERRARMLTAWRASEVGQKCLYVDYAEYQNLDAAILRIAAYLEVDVRNKMPELRVLYKPSPVAADRKGC